MSGSLHNSVVALEFVQMCLELFVRGVIGQRQPKNCRRLDQHFMFKLLSLAQLQNQNKKNMATIAESCSRKRTHLQPFTVLFNPNLVCGEKVVSKFGELRVRRKRKLALGWRVKAGRKRYLRSWLDLQQLRY